MRLDVRWYAPSMFRRVKRVYLVRRRHRLKLTARRLTRFADVDRFYQRKITHPQQLTTSGVVTDADDDTIADHRVFDAVELAHSSHTSSFTQENVEA